MMTIGAASTATHCAVFAQLIVKGKKCGVKTFIVQLRDVQCVNSFYTSRLSLSDHGRVALCRTFQLKPGINIGDIGKKMGRDGIGTS
jgi:acyl-CoA oxidase